MTQWTAAAVPLKQFMLRQTRESDIAVFAKLANQPQMNGPEDVPMKVLVPAYVISELKTAFQIGFVVFIPFLIIDLVVASVLMSMGMMMLSPVDHFAAVQAHVVRAGRRLESDGRLAGAQLLYLRRSMTPEMVLNLVRQALEVTILVSAPLLLTALVTGLLVSVFQAATQINEMTLSFIPKLLAIFLALVIAGPWMLGVMVDFTRRLILGIPGMIG